MVTYLTSCPKLIGLMVENHNNNNNIYASLNSIIGCMIIFLTEHTICIYLSVQKTSVKRSPRTDTVCLRKIFIHP
jgi:hypothetical protein